MSKAKTSSSAPARAEAPDGVKAEHNGIGAGQAGTLSSYGRGPDDEQWTRTLSALRKAYSFTGVPDLFADFGEYFLPIEWGIDLTAPATSDGFPHPASDIYQPMHVELLLDRAADYLERCSADRIQWNQFGRAAFDVAMSVMEYSELDRIHADEIANGAYDVAQKESAAALAAETSAEGFLDHSATQLKNHLDKILTDHAYLERIGGLNAQVTVSPLGAGLQELYAHPRLGRKKKDDFLYEVAREFTGLDLESQELMLEVQRQDHAGAARVSEARTTGLRARSEWDKKDGGEAGYRRRRTDVAKRLEDFRAKAAADRGGLLNYIEVMEPLKKRFARDWHEAIALMSAAQSGLDAIYGYEQQLPKYGTAHYFTPIEEPDSGRYFDECVLWVRDAIAYLGRLALRDSTFVLPVSLRGEVSNNAGWDPSQPIRFSLKYPDDLIVGCRWRLRGISAYTIGGGTSPVHVVLTTPDQASEYKQPNGSCKSLPHGQVTPAIIAPVAQLSVISSPTIVAHQSHLNVSPIRTWEVIVSRKDSLPSVPPDDVVLQFHLVAYTGTS
jgi:hypothetical protein